MDKQSRTGTRDITYDLVSIIYHSLQGAEVYSKYLEDAAQAKDNELGAFFREVQEEERERADRAMALLKKRLIGGKAVNLPG